MAGEPAAANQLMEAVRDLAWWHTTVILELRKLRPQGQQVQDQPWQYTECLFKKQKQKRKKIQL